MRAWLAAALLGVACIPAAAQYDDDEATRDYEAQDRRYLERLKQSTQPQAQEGPIEDPSELFLERAEALVRDKNYRSAETSRYRVQSDDPRLDAQATAEFLESLRDYFDTFWNGQVELAPYDKTSRVFLLYSFYKYNQLLAGDFRFSPIRPRGHYGSLYDAISLHSDPGDEPGPTADALAHEATHQLVDQRVFGGRRSPAIWLTEGLASYFGYTRMDADGFHDGQIGGKTVALFHEAKGRPGGEARSRLREFSRARKDWEKLNDTGLLAHILSIDNPGGFYGERPDLNYTASWLLVHTLLHADARSFREGFARYLALEAVDEGGVPALLREIGTDLDGLQAAFDRHTKTLKAR